MGNKVTLAQVEELAAELPPRDQLKLLAHIGERLSIAPVAVLAEEVEDKDTTRARQKRLARLRPWLAQCEKVAERWDGTFESAADLRRLRDER